MTAGGADSRELVVGTRGSALALAQTRIVCDALRALHPALAIRVERIATAGDVKADVPLSELGRGIFVTEIEAALREGRIDAAVHSAKDLPSTLATDLTLAALLSRADARDVLVSRAGRLRELPPGARVGTSSPRRACQLRALRPDLQPLDVRGNVDTRLRKLANGEYDALVLAAAGLIRLGRVDEITEWLDLDEMIPSVGQGALAIETRANDARAIALLRALDHADTRCEVLAERAFLAELGAGCRAAAGAHAVVTGHRLTITALIGAPDGRHVRTTRDGAASSAQSLGVEVARELLRAGGAEFLAAADSALACKRVALTRPAAQSAELVALLRARGAIPVPCPTIAVQAIADTTELDSALRDAAAYAWIAFTSANAVHAVADRLAALGTVLPRTVKLAAVGGSTARALLGRMRAADFVPSNATADTLAAELPERGTVLFPRGDLARDGLTAGLSRRGTPVRDVVVYRTIAGTGAADLAALVRSGQLDAIVFTSPSSIRFARGIVDAMRDATDAPVVACIGATTARAARDAGLEPDVEPATQSVGAIVEALERRFAVARAQALLPV
ncbi:MAG: hydroxymethylbilane synthase [Gemmatimonadaceae bacterium]